MGKTRTSKEEIMSEILEAAVVVDDEENVAVDEEAIVEEVGDEDVEDQMEELTLEIKWQDRLQESRFIRVQVAEQVPRWSSLQVPRGSSIQVPRRSSIKVPRWSIQIPRPSIKVWRKIQIKRLFEMRWKIQIEVEAGRIQGEKANQGRGVFEKSLWQEAPTSISSTCCKRRISQPFSISVQGQGQSQSQGKIETLPSTFLEGNSSRRQQQWIINSAHNSFCNNYRMFIH